MSRFMFRRKFSVHHLLASFLHQAFSALFRRSAPVCARRWIVD